jgi:two-component system, chemotaxis family, chemotaxis protein CheY
VYADVLRDDGWDVHAARDGLEALKVLEDGADPCVVVLDLRMPRMDGWTLVAELRRRHLDSRPFVVMAAHYQLQEEARRLGVKWWLQKPVGIARLLDTVAEACADSRVTAS